MEKEGNRGSRGTDLIGEEYGIWHLVWTMVPSTVPGAGKSAQPRRGLLSAKGGEGKARSQPSIIVTQPG